MTRDDPFGGMASSRLARTYYVDGGGNRDSKLRNLLREDYGSSSLYLRMFQEDVGHMLPWRSGSSADARFVVTLEGADDSTRQLVLDSLPGRNGPPRILEDGIRDFVEATSRDLTLGPSHFEVVFFSDDAGDLRSFAFEPLMAKSVSRSRRRVIQMVPAEPGLPTRRGIPFVELDPARIITIELPRPLRRALSKAVPLWRAAANQSLRGTDLLIDHTRGYDFKVQQRLIADQLLRSTAKIGWSGRDLLTEATLDPYKVARHLNFVSFQIEVRNAIVAGLQRGLDLAGTKIGFKVKLGLDQVVTLDDVEQAKADLNAGTQHIGALMRIER